MSAAHTTIGYHEDLGQCPAWSQYVRPLIESLRDKAAETALTGNTPDEREEARHARNTLKRLLERLDDDLAAALRAVGPTATVSKHIASHLQPSPLATPPVDIPGTMTPDAVTIESLMGPLIAQLPPLPTANSTTASSS
ncbi:MAG: hypothetical protein ACOYMN_26415 [Roseimicrobium sp.]